MDDATGTIYSAFLVEEEGTASTFRALLRARRVFIRGMNGPMASIHVYLNNPFVLSFPGRCWRDGRGLSRHRVRYNAGP